MAIVFKALNDGAFVAGDTETGNTSYAYPSSAFAVSARRDAQATAAAMTRRANEAASLCSPSILADYNRRQWSKLSPQGWDVAGGPTDQEG